MRTSTTAIGVAALVGTLAGSLSLAADTHPVIVTNTGALSEPVGPGPTPSRDEKRIQAKMEFSLAGGVAQQQSSFAIPAGKRLLIDQIAVYARVPDPSQQPFFFVYTAPYSHCDASNPSCPLDVVAPVGSTGLRIFPPADKSGLNHAETQTISLFAEGSISIEHARVPSTGSSFGWVIITGRLVDIPTD